MTHHIACVKATYEVVKKYNRKINQQIYDLLFMNCLNIRNIYEKKGA